MTRTQMLAEAGEVPARIEALLTAHVAPYAELAAALKARPPAFVATIARGSSDHAATYAASLIARRTGILTASLPPSLVTRYGAPLKLRQCLALGISQSGASSDLVAAMQAAAKDGAMTAALVNRQGSPLAAAADFELPQAAGPETAVAATKSFIASLAGAALLVARWADDVALMEALHRLPGRLEEALRTDWPDAMELLLAANRVYVVARGPALGIAQETALKLKETSGLLAEAVSAAELQHGPKAAIDRAMPILAFALADEGGEDTARVARELEAAGRQVIEIGPKAKVRLPEPLHPLLDPIVAIAAFYPFASALAVARGRDPDAPEGLSKVTITL